MSHHVFISLTTGSRSFQFCIIICIPFVSAPTFSVFASVFLPKQNKASCFYMQMTANLVTCLLSKDDNEFTFQPKITCFEIRKWKDVQHGPCTFVICFLLLSPLPVCAADALLCLPCIHIYNHATHPPFFSPSGSCVSGLPCW